MGTLKTGFNLASLLMSQNDPLNYLKSSIKMGKWLWRGRNPRFSICKCTPSSAQWPVCREDLSVSFCVSRGVMKLCCHYCTTCSICDSWTNCCEEWAGELPSAQIPVNHIPRLVATQWNLLFTIQLILIDQRAGKAEPLHPHPSVPTRSFYRQMNA